MSSTSSPKKRILRVNIAAGKKRSFLRHSRKTNCNLRNNSSITNRVARSTSPNSLSSAHIDSVVVSKRSWPFNFATKAVTPRTGTRLVYYKQTTNQRYTRINQILNLNFRRHRFFPSVRSYKNNNVFLTTSLGLFWKYYFKPKAFRKSKTMYLVSASFLRKVLLYCSLNYIHLYINKTPRYLNEILSKINEPAISVYNHPFEPQELEISEGDAPDNFVFSSIIFLNNKNYGVTKLRKRGRLKRKIFRRLVAANRVLD